MATSADAKTAALCLLVPFTWPTKCEQEIYGFCRWGKVMNQITKAYLLCFLLACGTCLGQPAPTESPAFSEEKAPAYAYQRVKTKKEREKFLNTYSDVQQNVIYRLNRIDSGSLYRLDTLVIPVPSDSAFQMHSPFPEQLLWARELGKLVIFSYRIQAFLSLIHI